MGTSYDIFESNSKSYQLQIRIGVNLKANRILIHDNDCWQVKTYLFSRQSICTNIANELGIDLKEITRQLSQLFGQDC